ncbi:MAG: hypothetical protein JWP92_1406 [Caulobacter sp.]|nr:hypothetical protein [Caulobacter sp.]
MSDAFAAPADDATGHEGLDRPRLGAADWLGLAAAPTFAVMALLTSVLGGGKMAMICGVAQEPSSLGGMVAMYLLMSGFHSGPWLKLIARRRLAIPI